MTDHCFALLVCDVLMKHLALSSTSTTIIIIIIIIIILYHPGPVYRRFKPTGQSTQISISCKLLSVDNLNFLLLLIHYPCQNLSA